MNVDVIGIVVIGRNEGHRLLDCLRSLGPHIEHAVYVDSGSEDGSVAAASQLGAAVVNLDMGLPFTAARARNVGFLALTSKNPGLRYVQFIDGDCELDADWIGKARVFMESCADVAVVCGRRRERHREKSIYNRLCDIEWNTPIGVATACGGDALMRVDAFREVDGFRADLIAGEEPELCVRLRRRGWRIWRLDAEMTRHDAAMTKFSQWWFRAVRSGYAATEISMRYAFSRDAAHEKRRVLRALLWAGVLPATILASSCFYLPALLGLLIYPLQICRIATRRGILNEESWIYALFMMMSKCAESYGLAKYCYRSLRRRPIKLIEYKGAGA